MNTQAVRSWDQRYQSADILQTTTARVLQENLHLLPSHGQALDLACGLGANARTLATTGLSTWAWDSSAVAIAKLNTYAQTHSLNLIAQARDVIAQPPETHSFDVIVVTYFLERALFPALCAALRPGGLLFYQTFSHMSPPTHSHGPTNPAFRLAAGELLQLCAPLCVRAYREEGLRGEVLFVGQAR